MSSEISQCGKNIVEKPIDRKIFVQVDLYLEMSTEYSLYLPITYFNFGLAAGGEAARGCPHAST
jgi:hypothetical protein